MVGFPKGEQPLAQCACLPAAAAAVLEEGGGASLSSFHSEQTPQVCQVPTRCRLNRGSSEGNQPEKKRTQR